MFLQSAIAPVQGWNNREVIERSLRCVVFNFVDESGIHPVVVSDKQSLGVCFLTTKSVCIIVALPCDKIDFLEDTRSQGFPVDTLSLEPNLSVN